MTTPAQQAREVLVARLRELRKDARLTGRALAIAAGWQESKVSKIEHGKQNPSEDDLRVWCRICEGDEQLPDLIASVRDIEAMYVEWRRMQRSGLRRLQEAAIPLYERTSVFRVYDPTMIPGLFQTSGYAAALMSRIIEFRGINNDLDVAVAARIERQRVLYHGDRRFLVVIDEQALRTRIGNVDVMGGQLDRLMTVMSLPRISIGIIPSTGDRRIWSVEGFWIFDDRLVLVETVSAELNIKQPREVSLYARTFERLQQSSVYGDEARTLIVRAMAELR